MYHDLVRADLPPRGGGAAGGVRRGARRFPGVVPRPARHRDPRAGAPTEERLSLRRGPRRGDPVQRRAGDLFLGDLRLGAGFRLHPRLQTVFALTLPTTTGPPGYGREVVSANLLNTAAACRSRRDWCSRQACPAGTRRRTGSLRALQRSSSLRQAPGCDGGSGDASRSSGTCSYTVPIITTPALPALDRRDCRWISAGSCRRGRAGAADRNDGGSGAGGAGGGSGLSGREDWF